MKYAKLDVKTGKWQCKQCEAWVDSEEMLASRCADCRMAQARIEKLEASNSIRFIDLFRSKMEK